MKNKNLLGIGSLVSATFIYGFFGILTRIVGFTFALFFQNWVRNLLSVLLLIIPLVVFKQWSNIRKKDFKWMVARSVAGIVCFIGSFVAFYFIPIGTAYFLFYGTMTTGCYILGAFLFKEKLTPIKILSLVLSIVGLLLIYSLNINLNKAIYIFAAIIAGLGSATWNTFSKKISGNYSALQLNFMDFLLSFIICFVISFFLKEQWVYPTISKIWIANLLFVVMFLLTGQLMIVGFKHIDAQKGGLIMLLVILFGILFSYFFFKETISISTLAGGGIILLAIILPEIKWQRNKSQ